VHDCVISESIMSTNINKAVIFSVSSGECRDIEETNSLELCSRWYLFIVSVGLAALLTELLRGFP
jgi:hypothetical protein